jgi:hypothetical protein
MSNEFVYYFKFLGDDFLSATRLYVNCSGIYYTKNSSKYFTATLTELNNIVKYRPKYALQL